MRGVDAAKLECLIEIRSRVETQATAGLGNVTSERHLKCSMEKHNDGSEDVCSGTAATSEHCRGLKGVMGEK